MSYSNFFILEHGWATRYYWLKPIEWNIEKDEIKQIKRQKIKFGTQSGTMPGDIVGSSIVIDFYSEKFVNLLKENKIKSFEDYSIIFDSKYSLETKYFYLEFKTKVSEIFIENKSKYNIHLYKDGKTIHGQKGLYFNLKEWHGEDIFGIKDTSKIIVTKKLKELIQKAKLKNIVFTNLDDYNWGVYE